MPLAGRIDDCFVEAIRLSPSFPGALNVRAPGVLCQIRDNFVSQHDNENLSICGLFHLPTLICRERLACRFPPARKWCHAHGALSLFSESALMASAVPCRSSKCLRCVP